MNHPPHLRYCTRCVYPSTAAAAAMFDQEGVCTGCRVHDQKRRIDWDERHDELGEILEEYCSKDGSNYDCLIPVSGGKNSHYQTYVICEAVIVRAAAASLC